MSFLEPLFLVAAGAVAVPILLHLVHRHESRRVVFPAIRYLLRTEREHARRIRLRQLLLLLARTAVVLLVVAAGARLFLRGEGEAHDPTALAVVLDNSLSSSLVLGEERVLDGLRDRAREALELAGPDDRIWVLRAAEPWDGARPLGAAAARTRVDSTEPSAAPADLRAAVARARTLVEAADLPASEIHLLSDLQRTGFPDAGPEAPAGDVPVVVLTSGAREPVANHRVDEVVVGGGLPPLSGQRTDIAVRLATFPETDTARPLPVRVVTGERVRAAGAGLPGHEVVLTVGPFSGGTVAGWVETDPDALRADDRRWFVFDVRPPVRVLRAGDASLFLDEALRVLEDAGRVVPAGTGTAEVLLSLNGEGLEGGNGTPAVVVPAPDATLLPALNRRLSAAGVPWRYGPPGGRGEAVVEENRLPVDLGDLRVPRSFAIRPADGAAPRSGETPVRLSGDLPLVVTGRTASGPYLLFAVPFDPGWSDLPVSAAMVPLLEWATTHWAGRGSERGIRAGEPIPTPPSATAVRDPSGAVHPIDGARAFPATSLTGIYEVLAGDSVVHRVPVNPPTTESLLEAVDPGDLPSLLGRETVSADGARAWRRSIFRSRQGPELWRPLLLAALLLLLVESWIAGSGAAAGRGRPGTTSEPPEHPGRRGGTPEPARGAPDRGGRRETGRVGPAGAPGR